MLPHNIKKLFVAHSIAHSFAILIKNY